MSAVTTSPRTLTSAELDALPLGAAVRCTTDYGRVVLALKVGTPQGSGGHIWRTTDYSTHPGSFAIAQANAVLLEAVEPGPIADEDQVVARNLDQPAIRGSSIVRDGRTFEHDGIGFRRVGKGIAHCQVDGCRRITHNPLSHAAWHVTGAGDEGY